MILLRRNTGRLPQRIGALVRRRLHLPASLCRSELLGQEIVTRGSCARDGSDAGWLVALARHAASFFDIGANVGQSSLLALLPKTLSEVILVEANPDALVVAAENLIRNHLAANVRFVSAFAGELDDSTVTFWSTETARAGSIHKSLAKTAVRANRSQMVTTITVDRLCDLYGIVPDLVKIDVEGAELGVLRGGRGCATQRKTRFLVEVHSSSELPMLDNAAGILQWCDAARYAAWYLTDGRRLADPEQVHDRGRCHLLLQPADWPYPSWLVGVPRSATPERGLTNDGSEFWQPVGDITPG